MLICIHSYFSKLFIYKHNYNTGIFVNISIIKKVGAKEAYLCSHLTVAVCTEAWRGTTGTQCLRTLVHLGLRI